MVSEHNHLFFSVIIELLTEQAGKPLPVGNIANLLVEKKVCDTFSYALAETARITSQLEKHGRAKFLPAKGWVIV